MSPPVLGEPAKRQPHKQQPAAVHAEDVQVIHDVIATLALAVEICARTQDDERCRRRGRLRRALCLSVVCLSLSLSLCVSVSLRLSVSISLALSLALSLSLSRSLALSRGGFCGGRRRTVALRERAGERDEK
eukprot:3019801-Prymnesium_polylepis.1